MPSFLSRLVLLTPPLRANLSLPSLSSIYLAAPTYFPKPFLDCDPRSLAPLQWLHVWPDNSMSPYNPDALDRLERLKQLVLPSTFHINHNLSLSRRYCRRGRSKSMSRDFSHGEQSFAILNVADVASNAKSPLPKLFSPCQ